MVCSTGAASTIRLAFNVVNLNDPDQTWTLLPVALWTWATPLFTSPYL